MADEVIHSEASYEHLFGLDAKSDMGWDSREGMEYLHTGPGDTDSWMIETEPNCDGCAAKYFPYVNPDGHIALYRTRGTKPLADSKRLDLSYWLKMHKLLYALFYAGHGFEIEGQGQSISIGGGVDNYGFWIVSVNQTIIRVKSMDALDPRSIPIQPNHVVTFCGGTNFDQRIRPMITHVNYDLTDATNCTCDITVNWNVGDLLTNTGELPYDPDTNPTPNTYLQITVPPMPSWALPKEHERITTSRRTVTLRKADDDSWPDLDGYGAHSCLLGNTTENVRIAQPISGVAFETFRVEVWDAVNDWVNVTASVGPNRIQCSHSAGEPPTDFATKIYLRNYIPDASGIGWESEVATDLLDGKSRVRLTYFPASPVGLYSQPSMRCGNCKRDYMNWIATANSYVEGHGVDYGKGVDTDGNHWFCAAWWYASGVGAFSPGVCSLARNCNAYSQGADVVPTPLLLGQVDGGRYVALIEYFPGDADPSNFGYYWGGQPSLLLLGGADFDVPAQKYENIVYTQGNGCMGWWLYGELSANNLTSHRGAIYDIDATPADYNDVDDGLFVLGGATASDPYIPHCAAIAGTPESDATDPLGAHRRYLQRKFVSVKKDLGPDAGDGCFVSDARTTGTYEGENRNQRCMPDGTESHIYLPRILIASAGSSTFGRGKVTRGSWTIGGVTYGIKIEVFRERKYGLRALRGGPGAGQGTVAGNNYEYAGGLLMINCLPGERHIAEGVEGEDDLIHDYNSGGNVVELPDNLRPQSHYDNPEYLHFGNVQDLAYAGDTIEFPGIAALAGHKFYIRKAQPCSGAVHSGAPPTGQGYRAVNNSFLSKCDQLWIADEGDLLSVEDFTDAVFQVDTAGVFEDGGAVTLKMAEWLGVGGNPTFDLVDSDYLLVLRGMGEIYVTEYFAALFNNVAKRYCFLVTTQLVGDE